MYDNGSFGGSFESSLRRYMCRKFRGHSNTKNFTDTIITISITTFTTNTTTTLNNYIRVK